MTFKHIHHTPGPWRVDAQYICRADGVAIADVWQSMEVSGEEAETNARLIAAAPDLLAALERIMSVARCPTMNERLSACWKIAHDAIAKARGE
jgi:hypothetical protein